MSSHKKFEEMMRFVNEKTISPPVKRVVDDIENLETIDRLFEDMKKSGQCEKLIVKINPDSQSNHSDESKL